MGMDEEETRLVLKDVLNRNWVKQKSFSNNTENKSNFEKKEKIQKTQIGK